MGNSVYRIEKIQLRDIFRETDLPDIVGSNWDSQILYFENSYIRFVNHISNHLFAAVKYLLT